MQYATAYGALIDIARFRGGRHGADPRGIQQRRHRGDSDCEPGRCDADRLTRTSSKRHPLLELGAAHVIATDEQDLVAEVKKLTGGKGARVVFDPVGGPTLAKLTGAMADGGILFLYGALSPTPTPLPLFEVLGKTAHDPRLPAV